MSNNSWNMDMNFAMGQLYSRCSLTNFVNAAYYVIMKATNAAITYLRDTTEHPVAGISPLLQGRNGYLPSIGQKGRFLVVKCKKNGHKAK